MVKYLLSAILSVHFFSAIAQKKCATDQVQDRLLQRSPQLSTQLTQDIYNYLEEQKSKNALKLVSTPSGEEIHVPIVVHIIHTGGAVGSIYNPSDAEIADMMTTLNNNFGNTFDDPSVAGTFNSTKLPIVFELAKRTPTCTSTTGIDRINLSSNATYVADGVSSGGPGINDNIIFETYHWPTSDYYNIYIVNKIDGEDGNGVGVFTAGYANSYFGSNQVAYLTGIEYDGFMVLASQIYLNNVTAGHEVAHSFDLKHPFGNVSSIGACETPTGNCAVDNDEVCDTDPVTYSFTCNPSGNNPCTGQPYSASTTQYNYMSYFGCTDRFTAGQATKMLNQVNTYRPGFKGTIAMNPLPAWNVTPASCNPTLQNVGNGNSMGPLSVQIGSLYTHGGTYTENLKVVEDRTCMFEPIFYLNQANTVNIQTLQNRQYVKVYIDYNNNGVFNLPAEEAFSSIGGTGTIYNHTGTITIPSTAVLNTPIRMRVIADFKNFASNTLNPLTPCYNMIYGQAEDYAITIQAAPLALAITNFELSNDAHSVTLNWKYQNTQTLYDFVVERSSNLNEWSEVARIDVKSAAQILDYQALDQNPLFGKSYYRIKAVGPNGFVDFSNVLSTFRTYDRMVETSPNPATNEWHIDLSSAEIEPFQIAIYDINGKIITKQNGKTEFGNQRITVETENFANGIYFANITLNKMTFHKKFVVSK